MTERLAPEEYPFGQTEYHNYDPQNVNTVADAVEVLEWIAEQNREESPEAQGAFQDAANLLKRELIDDE